MPRKRSSFEIVPIDRIQSRILLLRGQRVIIDADLSRLFGVTTKALNQQVKRNPDRFPKDFVFQLSKREKQEVVANCDHLSQLKFSSQLPYAFTEHGAIMAATVLNSPQAVKASLFVVRAFVQLRQLLSTHHQLADKINELESRLQNHDDQIVALIDAIRELMEDPESPPKPPIGFQTELTQPRGASQKRRLAGAKA